MLGGMTKHSCSCLHAVEQICQELSATFENPWEKNFGSQREFTVGMQKKNVQQQYLLVQNTIRTCSPHRYHSHKICKFLRISGRIRSVKYLLDDFSMANAVYQIYLVLWKDLCIAIDLHKLQ